MNRGTIGRSVAGALFAVSGKNRRGISQTVHLCSPGRPWLLTGLALAGLGLMAPNAFAETEDPVDESDVADAPSPALEVPAVVVPVTESDTVTAPPSEEPEAKPASKPTLTVGIGLRTGVAFSVNNPSDQVQVKLDDGLVDQVNLRPYFTGQLNEYIGFFAQFETGTHNMLGLEILDAIVQVKLADEFQIWMGQFIGANDRTNTNGPFFNNGWNLAIAVPTYPFDVGARDRGVTLWGLLGGGLLKYHASMMDLQPGQNLKNARYGGRVTLNLLDPETSYYTSGTYYGQQDVLALAAVVNYQKGFDDPTMPGLDNDFMGFSFDALFEKNFGGAGTITLESGYWDFTNTGADYKGNQGTIDDNFGYTPGIGRGFFASGSWLSPTKVGIGQLQPNARWQLGDYEGQKNLHVVDLGTGYIIDGFNHRWHFNYRRVNGAIKEDILQLGVQIMM